MYSLIGKVIAGLMKSGTTVGATAIKTTKALKTSTSWKVTDLETTPWLYGPDHVRDIAKEAIKNKDEHALAIVEEYLLKHGVDRLGGYGNVFRGVRKALKELEVDDFL